LGGKVTRVRGGEATEPSRLDWQPAMIPFLVTPLSWVIKVSHISLIRVKIVNPNMDLLKHAVENLAKEMGAEICDSIVNYYGRPVNMRGIVAAIRNNVFHRGVGIMVKDGEVKLKGDFYGVPDKEIENLKLGLVKHYTALATATALRNIGYQVQSTKVKDSIYIKAIAW